MKKLVVEKIGNTQKYELYDSVRYYTIGKESAYLGTLDGDTKSISFAKDCDEESKFLLEMLALNIDDLAKTYRRKEKLTN